MKPTQQASRAMLVKATRLLSPLQEDFVYLGGLALALLISDPAAPDVRPTEDVDVIVEVVTYSKYVQLEERLRAVGFVQPRADINVICRWMKDSLIIDIMPTNAAVLGFGNRWYRSALRSARMVSIAADVRIRVISALCFLATKIEAFQSGQRGDYFTSRDLDDVISLIDGRPEIISDTRSAEPEVRAFLAEAFQKLLNNEEFLDALPNFLYSDAASQARHPLILSRMQDIANLIYPL